MDKTGKVCASRKVMRVGVGRNTVKTRQVLLESWSTMIKMGIKFKWGISSVGRAIALQAIGRRFDPVILHQNLCNLINI